MYVLHIANKVYSSWSLRPWALMRQLGIAFEERVHPFGGPSFRTLSPTARVPVLVDGSTTVWDSLAIVEYLAERHAGVWPDDGAARAWARCAAAEMHSGFQVLRARCAMCVGLRIRLAETPEALDADVARIDALWTEGLQRFGGPFLAGAAFTAVDAFFCPVAYRVQTYGLALSQPSRGYCERLLETEATRRWTAEALSEPWRDPPHESSLRAAGEWLEDLRTANA
jgi:glutathione S-transferase